MTTVVKFYVPYQVVPSQLQLQIITNFQVSYGVGCFNQRESYIVRRQFYGHIFISVHAE